MTLRSDPESRFTPGAWLVLAFALGLLLLGAAQLAYRFTLPTDGWSVYTEEVADLQGTWVYDMNLVGAPSGIQAGDKLLAVNGVSLQSKAMDAGVPAPPNWQVGRSVTMLVRRGSAQQSLAVPVVHWTGRSLWRYNMGQLDKVGFSLGTLLLIVVGWFTFLRRPGVPSARALLLLSTSIGAIFISGALPDGLSVQFNPLAVLTTSFYSYMIFGTLLAPSLLAFALLFPKPKQVIHKRPWLALAPYGYGLLLLGFLVGGGNGIVGWVSTLGMFVAAILSLIHAGFTQRDAVSRAQLRWAISSFILGVGLFTLNFPVAFLWVTNLALINLFSALANLGFAVIGIGFAVAILRYHLFDIDIIIRRTLQYSLLSGLLALVYFGSVVLLQGIFGARAPQAVRPPLIIVISTLVIAVLFNPLRRRIQDLIDRRFFRSKYNAEQALAQFAAAARDEVDLERLTGALLNVVEETMRPEQVGLWLKPTNKS
jgi:hypothetical protein